MADEEQAVEGYLCKCGYNTDDLRTFRSHLLVGSKDGKGVHKSAGRVNLLSGEITMPPYDGRSTTQKHESAIGKKKKEPGTNEPGGGYKSTEIMSQASSVRFVPRQMTCTLTPIMTGGLEAVTRVFGWRADMPFENFLDTVIYNYLLEHGVQLAGFIIDDSVFDPEPEPEPEPEPIPPSNGNGQFKFLKILEEV